MGGAAAGRVHRLRAGPEEDGHALLPGGVPPRQRPASAPLSPEEATPLLAEAASARDPAGETLLLLGSAEVVEKARIWVTTVLGMEQFLREGTHDPEAWQDLLERQRAGRQGYYAAVRDDLALPPGHSAHWVLPPVNSA